MVADSAATETILTCVMATRLPMDSPQEVPLYLRELPEEERRRLVGALLKRFLLEQEARKIMAEREKKLILREMLNKQAALPANMSPAHLGALIGAGAGGLTGLVGARASEDPEEGYLKKILKRLGAGAVGAAGGAYLGAAIPPGREIFRSGGLKGLWKHKGMLGSAIKNVPMEAAQRAPDWLKSLFINHPKTASDKTAFTSPALELAGRIGPGIALGYTAGAGVGGVSRLANMISPYGSSSREKEAAWTPERMAEFASKSSLIGKLKDPRFWKDLPFHAKNIGKMTAKSVGGSMLERPILTMALPVASGALAGLPSGHGKDREKEKYYPGRAITNAALTSLLMTALFTPAAGRLIQGGMLYGKAVRPGQTSVGVAKSEIPGYMLIMDKIRNLHGKGAAKNKHRDPGPMPWTKDIIPA